MQVGCLIGCTLAVDERAGWDSPTKTVSCLLCVRPPFLPDAA
jgi:hypothetical protein